ncbi:MULTISPECIES: hypothetical protein [unclassified Flavobacterium]|uniref:hypothetical protein n=1 Tax=unclassified Flavobacterium TaxID=196869 RepID=UPI0006ABA4CE|nr:MULTISPECIES: hypothetical protein [unclassified Flavobacterium]KOP39709.1 hypothetical protein AKO67_02125 [Flavobacterium sp. VMW]OWU92490.1 hypothetical protein APR43_00035 [Flavobacterium sp. NLM]
MKKLFQRIILLLLLTSNFTNAQSQDLTLQKLIDNQLINQEDVSDFELKQLDFKMENKTSYLYGLFQCEFKKLHGHFYFQVITDMVAIEDEQLTEGEQKKENIELSDYLFKLKKCDLINEKQFSYFQQQINNNSYSYKIQFLKDITNKTLNADHLERLKKFANFLKEYKIADTKYESLIAAIDQEKIKEHADLLLYCERSITIDTKDDTNEPKEYLEAIYKKTASLSPELNFTDFELKIVPDTDKFYDFIVSLKSGGKIYKQKSSYRVRKSSKDDFSINKINCKDYYQIFNKILNDQHSPYRLHEIKFNVDETYPEVLGIMMLTKEQEKALKIHETYIIPSQEDYKKKFTTSQIDKVIEEYSNIGLFSYLSAAQINLGKENVAEQENNNYIEILSAFPNIIYSIPNSLPNFKDSYAELTKEYSKISHNQFNPTNISNIFDKKTKKSTLKFKVGNKSYTKVLRISDYFIDLYFFEFIELVAAENKLNGKFYDLHTGGEGSKVIFLTKKQYDYIRANKLLLFLDQEPEYDE